jgi:NAD(P)-dependent dehydrogenase (short-subunit alcohol dehydrogenase family)
LRVNAVCPGDVDTPMLAGEAEELDEDIDDYLADAAEGSPNGRIAEPGEVAALVLYLASDTARHITGTAISIDGGATA